MTPRTFFDKVWDEHVICKLGDDAHDLSDHLVSYLKQTSI